MCSHLVNCLQCCTGDAVLSQSPFSKEIKNVLENIVLGWAKVKQKYFTHTHTGDIVNASIHHDIGCCFQFSDKKPLSGMEPVCGT